MRFQTSKKEGENVEMISQDHTQALSLTREDTRIAELVQKLNTISDLEAIAALAHWDQQTAIPVGANDVRGYQMATLQGIVHEYWTAPRLGELLKELGDVVDKATFTDADRGLVRWTQHIYERATKLPRDLVEEMERVGVSSIEAWANARAHNDFASFAPWLQRTVQFQREVADRIGFRETRYDALLDASDPGITVSQIERLFAPIRDVSTNLLRRIQASGQNIDDTCLHKTYPIEQQKAMCEQLLQHIGYDFKHGGIARSVHPFTTSFGSPDDVRLTVRYDEKFLQMSLMAALHEGGHGLYEQGQSKAFIRTPLASGVSMGVHESQSRLWENAIGRSLPFWQGKYSALQELFPQQFKDVDIKTYVRSLNKVQPSLIRVEADEVTYNLHIIIRFEIEQALINGDIAIESLPGLWNAKYREYLGIVPENDTVGILQDMHWATGFGYFPSYTLGNLYAAQIFHTLQQRFPDLDERLAHGDTTFLLKWLQENLYAFGSVYEPEKIIKRVTGSEADAQHLVDYLTNKFTQIYDLTV
jgi:carboxypeptidase Taq